MARVVEVRVSVIYLSVAKYLFIIYCQKGEGAREMIVATHGECQLKLAADDDSIWLGAYIYILYNIYNTHYTHAKRVLALFAYLVPTR